MLQFEFFADPNTDMRVEAPGSAEGTRQMRWEERFAYYKAKMGVLRTYGGKGECGICSHTRALVRFHCEGVVCSCTACPDCITLLSFRSRALNAGRDPVCPYCRQSYRERDLIPPELLSDGGQCG